MRTRLSKDAVCGCCDKPLSSGNSLKAFFQTIDCPTCTTKVLKSCHTKFTGTNYPCCLRKASVEKASEPKKAGAKKRAGSQLRCSKDDVDVGEAMNGLQPTKRANRNSQSIEIEKEVEP